jgi:hypothetical protein
MLSWLDYRTWRQASPHGSVQVIPRGWVVERLGSGEARRWSKDYERFPETEEAFIYSARLRCLLPKLV